MQETTPSLWFDGNAQQAAEHHVSVFKNSRIVNASRQGDAVFSLAFQLEGQQFMALNGGPEFKFTGRLGPAADLTAGLSVDTLEGGQSRRPLRSITSRSTRASSW